VVVTHDMKTAFHTADHIAFLHEGRIYFHGTVDQMKHSTDDVLQDFIQGRSGETD
jgi:phospholipid/cholesterol/gamma-HCH transport system ATP-binding protein